MESEKVKEIKKALEQNDDNGIMYEVNDQKRTCKFIHHKDILTLINDLESENERLMKLQARGGCRVAELGIENQQLKERIALLEKDNELLRNAKVVYENVDYCAEDLKKAEKRIAELEKELEKEQINNLNCDTELQYKEKRIAKLEEDKEKWQRKAINYYQMAKSYGIECIIDNDIDETLKEFI